MRFAWLSSFLCTWVLVVVSGSFYESLAEHGKAKVRHLKNGMEFARISRGTLLKLLMTFEDGVRSRAPTNMKPQFNAQFASNPLTKPFIYPLQANIMEPINEFSLN